MKIKYKKNKNNENEKLISKDFINDENGNISIIISSLVLISFLILSVVVLNTAINQMNENKEDISSSQYQYIMNDYIRNIPLIEREALKELSEEVIKNRRACIDSKRDLKEMIDEKLRVKNQEYWENYNVYINSYIVSIENTSNPFSYKFKSYISSVKGEYSFENIASDDVDCINLKDPIPLLYCKNYYGISYNETSYNYGNSLSEFLRVNEVENYSYYINASSPFIVKKCPYDPYKHHGDDNGKVMKNCRDNGYYHESRDGACYLCRLEGKSGCEHYGFETFINPQKTNETNLVSACGSDHVIFSDDIYPGVEVIYYSEEGLNEILYLDPHGHKLKYGMSGY
ncbi:hypothetical protein [Methanobrevibacter olleyae]|uniref:Uncharacterized protein n=1 Tax=Methanobrevibacter olleyae TaxID=294671 RepID=A0A126R1L7_METOL|nr:hypothetical protein [Methanobrevibacter olleyae]AMK16181.1 hypothetical protein YLM1_1626 [Methanobrevibacter olleyae]SFL52683.1 hypothetical protein SAMN02910297_01131 [Methanobrevibacter olleyae]